MSVSAFSKSNLFESPWFSRGLNQELLSQCTLIRSWQDEECTARLDNIGGAHCSIAEVVLYQIEHQLPHDTPIYGDGFQMLAQTAGCLGDMTPVGRCPDGYVYRLFDEDRERRLYNYIVLHLPGGAFCLLGFTACQRFSGFFRLGKGVIEVVMDTEGVHLEPGQHWMLEPLCVLQNESYASLMAEYADLIKRNHPRTLPARVPTGWCSWYHYYADVTAGDIRENLAEIATRWPKWEYLLLDDGYQSHMGDWLSPSDKFSGGVKRVIDDIHNAGLKPALWVAPFIAEPNSALFQQHPDWFVKAHDGNPLASESVTYGGWRRTPWYVLDGSHPAVQKHLFDLFSTLKHEWGISYFKLDANFWGAIHGGHFLHEDTTRVEAYRAGMQAINRAVGPDGILLGCNAPMWPSLGLVDAMRVSDDVERNKHRFMQLARETFYRNWQHRKLWLNDPDCVTLENLPQQQASAEDYQLHRNILLASAGLIFSGDRLQRLTPDSRRTLERLTEFVQEAKGAASFTDLALTKACIELGEQRLLFAFNLSHQAQDYEFSWEGSGVVTEYWSGNVVASCVNSLKTPELPPMSSMVWLVNQLN